MTGAEQPRATAARVLPEVFTEDWLREYLESIKNLTRGVSVEHTCAECKKRGKVYVQIPNFKEINETVLDLWNQAFGRPGTADGEPGGVSIVIERTWPVGDAEDSVELHAVAGAGSVPPK